MVRTKTQRRQQQKVLLGVTSLEREHSSGNNINIRFIRFGDEHTPVLGISYVSIIEHTILFQRRLFPKENGRRVVRDNREHTRIKR